MSFMKHKNRSGTKTVPCGTPEDTVDLELFSPFTITCCVLSVKKLLIHSRRVPFIPKWLSLWQRRTWETLSNALAKSIRITSVCLLSFMFSAISLTVPINCVSHDLFCWKPCCSLHNMLYFFRCENTCE